MPSVSIFTPTSESMWKCMRNVKISLWNIHELLLQPRGWNTVPALRIHDLN